MAGDILDYDDFFTVNEKLAYNVKAVDKHVRKSPGADWIAGLRKIVATTEPFDAATLQVNVEAFIAANNAKPRPVNQTLRVLVTGKEVGFSTFDTLAILGRDRCLARIDRAVNLQ